MLIISPFFMTSIYSIGSIQVIFTFDILDLQGGLDAGKDWSGSFFYGHRAPKGSAKNGDFFYPIVGQSNRIWVVLVFLWPSVGLCTTLWDALLSLKERWSCRWQVAKYVHHDDVLLFHRKSILSWFSFGGFAVSGIPHFHNPWQLRS